MKQTDSDAVVLECDLPEPRDQVWRALAEKELLAAWLPGQPWFAGHGAEPELSGEQAGLARAALAMRCPIRTIPATVSAGVSVRSTVCFFGITRVWPRTIGRMSRMAR